MAWKRFPHYWTFVRGIHRWLADHNVLNSRTTPHMEYRSNIALIAHRICYQCGTTGIMVIDRRSVIVHVLWGLQQWRSMGHVALVAIIWTYYPGTFSSLSSYCNSFEHRVALDGITWHLLMTHYNDVIMYVMASQIITLTIVYSSVYSGTDQWKQSSASLSFVRGIHRWPVNSPHKWPVTLKMFPFDDVIMNWAKCVQSSPGASYFPMDIQVS